MFVIDVAVRVSPTGSYHGVLTHLTDIVSSTE